MAAADVTFATPNAPSPRLPASASAPDTATPAPQPPGSLTSWEWAVLRVEEVRGSAGQLAVPEALRHEEDRRRFLAVQMADASASAYQVPHDSADLAQMILRGEVVELTSLGEGHILYDLGEDARDDPLMHYDMDTDKDVPLYSREEYEREDARLAADAEGKGPAANKAREQREHLSAWYRDPARAEQLFREHEAVQKLAREFGGLAYDLSDPIDRGRFKVRLLSFVRKEARDLIVELARAYHHRFARPLPVTSLIRSHRYQERLGRVNRNAAKVDLAPHTTGMAFDISYKFMPPDEQNFVMEEVAKLEAAGRVEALRERRNHLHVYVLQNGRPDEWRVAGFLPIVEAAHPGSAPRAAAAPSKKVPAKGARSPRRPAVRRAR